MEPQIGGATLPQELLRLVDQSRAMKRFPFLIRAVVLLALGPANAWAQQAGRHPDARNVDQSLKPTATLRFAGSAEPLPLRPAASTTAGIGSESGPDYQIFGAITDAAFLSDTSVAIVDRTAHAVRLFTTKGRYLGTIGRQGQGPGEFRYPVAVAVSPSGAVFVADLQRKIQVFVPSAKGYEYSRAIPVTFGVSDMCFLGKTLFVNGASLTDPFVIRALDDSGSVLRSFGSIYQSPNQSVTYQIRSGHLACEAAANLVVFMATSLLGEVRAYRPDGTPVWRVTVDGFLTNIVLDTPTGTTVERSPEGTNYGEALLSIPGDGILAQWGFNTPERLRAKEGSLTIHTVLLEPATGKPRLSKDPWPRVTAVRGRTLMVATEDPAPHVELRALERRP